MINPIMKNHSSLYENNRQTNKSVITHQNNDMTVYCKHKNLTYPLTPPPPPTPPHFTSKWFNGPYIKDIISVTICDFKENLLFSCGTFYRPKIELNYSWGTRPKVITLDYTQYIWFPKLNTPFSLPNMISIPRSRINNKKKKLVITILSHFINMCQISTI